MAIVFKEHSIEGKILNAYNNNIVVFGTDSPNHKYAAISITANGKDYEFLLYANLDGDYTFNFKQVVIALINRNNFADDCPHTPVGSPWGDENAFLEVDAGYEIFFEGGTETTEYTYRFIKAVYQIDEKALIENRGDKFLMHQDYRGEYYLTVFNGFPFSIGIFSENLTFTIDGVSHNWSVIKKAFRFIMSDGETIWSSLNSTHHKIVFNEKILNLEIVNNCVNGLYLKWHNRHGAWDYWLFDRFKDENQSKAIGQLYNDFDSLQDTSSEYISMGNDSQRSVSLVTNLSIENAARVRSIIDSPKVLLYLGQKGQSNDLRNWVEVNISGKSTAITGTGLRKTLEFTLTYHPSKNLTL